MTFIIAVVVLIALLFVTVGLDEVNRRILERDKEDDCTTD